MGTEAPEGIFSMPLRARPSLEEMVKGCWGPGVEGDCMVAKGETEIRPDNIDLLDEKNDRIGCLRWHMQRPCTTRRQLGTYTSVGVCTSESANHAFQNWRHGCRECTGRLRQRVLDPLWTRGKDPSGVLPRAQGSSRHRRDALRVYIIFIFAA